jgi:hypothetical protein
MPYTQLAAEPFHFELFKGTVKLKMGEGSHVWAFTEPAAPVGGDLHDVIPLAKK